MLPSLDTHLVTYPYQWGSPDVPPPAVKQIRTNSTADPTAVTKCWLHNLNLISDDVFLLLMQIEVGTTIYIQDHDNHAVFLQLVTTAPPVDLTTYVEFAVQYVDHAGAAVGNNQDLLVAFFAPAAEVVPPVLPGPPIVPPWAQPKMCYSVLTGPPVIEPITVDEAILRAGLEYGMTDPRRALVPKYIAAARSVVEKETGLALLTQVRDIYFWPYDPQQPPPLPSQSTPLQAITAMVPWVPGAPVVSPADIVVGATATGMKLTIVAGYPSVEALAAAAPGLVQAVGLLVAHMLTLGRDLAITGAVAAISETPQGFEDCIAPYRLMWVA